MEDKLGNLQQIFNSSIGCQSDGHYFIYIMVVLIGIPGVNHQHILH